MPRTSRVALLAGLALAVSLGNSGLALTAGIDWSSTSVFYTAAAPKKESTGLTTEATEIAGNSRAPSTWIGAASLALLGPMVATMMASRHPLLWPQKQVSHLKVPMVAPATADSDAAFGDATGRSSLGRAGLPTALLLTACAALGLRAVQRHAKGSRGSNGRAAPSLASLEGTPEPASVVPAVVEAAQPVAEENIPIQSAEQLPCPTKFFRIMTDVNQAPSEDVQQPAEFFRIMTDAEVPEAPKDFFRSVTVPVHCIGEVEPVKKQPTPPSTIDESDEEEEVHPSMAMLRGSTEPLPEEKRTKPESHKNTLAADIGRRGYVQTIRQKIEQQGLAVRAH